mmetsp:Transcript_6079/g.14547  ORF Transcript_6079/g.14547 Transcript_6079/m.14547 type:complete len:244 (-) Transcript_6079:18-749(-)
MLQRHHLVQHDATAPNIALEVVRPIFYYLWAQVIWRSHHRLGIVLGRIQDFGNPKVTKLDLPCGHEEYVLCLEVSVEHLAIMNVLQSEAHLHKPFHDRRLLKEGPLARFDGLVYVTTICVVHDDAQSSLPCHEHLLKTHNVGMVHLLQQHGFLHSLISLFLFHGRGLHLLDDTESICLHIPHKEGLAEGAFPEHFNALVLLIHPWDPIRSSTRATQLHCTWCDKLEASGRRLVLLGQRLKAVT